MSDNGKRNKHMSKLSLPYFNKERRKLLSQIFKDIGTITFVSFVINQFISDEQEIKFEIIIWGTIAMLFSYWAAMHWRPREE